MQQPSIALSLRLPLSPTLIFVTPQNTRAGIKVLPQVEQEDEEDKGNLRAILCLWFMDMDHSPTQSIPIYFFGFRRIKAPPVLFVP